MRIQLTERLSADHLATDVLLGDADVAIGPEPSPVALEITPLLREGFHLVVAPGHRFARRESVRVAELAGEPFVHLDPANSIAGRIDAVAAAAGIVLQPVVRVRTSTTVAAVAAAGLGVGLVPDDAARGHDGVAVPLQPPLFRQVVVIHRAPPQPLVEAFYHVLRGGPCPGSAGSAPSGAGTRAG